MTLKINNLSISKYVTIIFAVPETHADIVRESMGKAGAGSFENYSFCSFSSKGIGRFMPNQYAQPAIGTAHVLEAVNEEKIETICAVSKLEAVIAAIKAAHPYETMVIDIYPVYKIGIKMKQNLK